MHHDLGVKMGREPAAGRTCGRRNYGGNNPKQHASDKNWEAGDRMSAGAVQSVGIWSGGGAVQIAWISRVQSTR